MTIFELNIFWVHIAPTYYWLMYAIGFLIWYYIILKRWVLSSQKVESLFIYIFLWVVLWGRLWYVLFYNLDYYLQNPVSILYFMEWWLSFHWGVLWVILAMILFSKVQKESFLKVADEVTSVLPIWLFFWRIWNYLNKELLWFSGYNWPLAVKIWENSYFPSPLLEAFLEWIVLYLILFFFYKSKNTRLGQTASLFLVFYGIFRIFVELFFRTPDPQIWYIFWFLTMWIILTLPMVIFGLILFFIFRKNAKRV